MVSIMTTDLPPLANAPASPITGTLWVYEGVTFVFCNGKWSKVETEPKEVLVILELMELHKEDREEVLALSRVALNHGIILPRARVESILSPGLVKEVESSYPSILHPGFIEAAWTGTPLNQRSQE